MKYKNPEERRKRRNELQKIARKKDPERFKKYAIKNRIKCRAKAYITQKKYKENHYEEIKEYINNYNRVNYPKYKKKRLIRGWTLNNLKEKIYDKFANKCTICGYNEKLEIHHDKYTKNIKDVRLLCIKCHKALHTRINRQERRV